MNRRAIFVIDMLNDCFVHPELERRRASLGSTINELTGYARANSYPVVWVRQEFEPDLSDAMLDMKRGNIRMFIKGTRGSQILEELTQVESDLKIIKKRYSMFFGTELDALIERLGIDHVVLAGVNTHACIRVAAIDAYQRDLDVTIVRECVASKDVHHHDVTMDYLDGGIAKVSTLANFCGEFEPRRAR